MKTGNVFEDYVAKIDHAYRTGKATEHTYRGALADLVAALLPDAVVLNEPKRIECGAPDYIITRAKLPVAFIEAKDVGDSDLDGQKKTGNKEQFDRYKASLDHIAFTDYLDFHFYEKGELVESVRIGDVVGDGVEPKPENFAKFEILVKGLGDAAPQQIKSASQLAKLMAGKARLLERATLKLLEGPNGGKTAIGMLMAMFKQVLVPDVTAKDFSDVYAQTITYGLFAARLHDDVPGDFTRFKAAALIPKSNPFLHELFVHISSSLEDELVWIVDDLVTTFGASDIRKIMKNYGKSTAQSDPMIHFYEDFLAAYDAGLRKDRGVWYTPLPVVKFIVRAVDCVLQNAFGLPDGLATKDKVEVEVEEDAAFGKKATKKVKKSYHKVQVLDPATGTGTFLAECVNCVYAKFAGHAGKWKNYVKDDLLPRLNGFEILMASYTMAHVKLDVTLANTGYTHTGGGRFKVFLANSLEEYAETMGPLFASALGEEANAAKEIKRDCPVMVVLGNPPYSGVSKNKGRWIQKLVAEYKREPGSGEKLKERKNWLNDDYVKFIRLAESYVERNKEGVVAFVNNHGFVDNPTFRGMRWHLLQTFDEIYVLNLHGNSMKHETAPNGGKDENVFSITVGTSINVFVKTGKKKSGALAAVYYADLYGTRKAKFAYLEKTDFCDVGFKKATPCAPYYFFAPKNEAGKSEYVQGFGLNELMPNNRTAVLTMGDAFAVAETKQEMISRIEDFNSNSYTEAQLKAKFGLGKNYAAFILKGLPLDCKDKIVKYAYRPFDCRWVCFDRKTIWRQRLEVMKHLHQRENIAMAVCKQLATNEWNLVNVAEGLIDDNFVSNRTKERGYVFPLYLYEESFGKVERKPNFDAAIYGKIAAALKCDPSPEEVFDYVYAVLHTPEYRSKYKEFLKVDFPRIPYPKSAAAFAKLVAFGGELRNAHLLKDKHSQFEKTAAFAVGGGNVVEEVRFDAGRVYVNGTQYFDAVPEDVFNFHIGGYQPAQKWLKDRKGRVLTNDDCDHYQSIVLALVKTRDVMAALSKFSSKWLA